MISLIQRVLPIHFCTKFRKSLYSSRLNRYGRMAIVHQNIVQLLYSTLTPKRGFATRIRSVLWKNMVAEKEECDVCCTTLYLSQSMRALLVKWDRTLAWYEILPKHVLQRRNGHPFKPTKWRIQITQVFYIHSFEPPATSKVGQLGSQTDQRSSAF